MGRRITKNRKISSDRVGKIRNPKAKIIIAVEGKNKTEKIYFSNFDDGKKEYSISFAKGNYTDPLNLVNMLIKEITKIGIDLDDGDEAYCIFDTDTNPNKNKMIREATKLAKENGIKVITSTPSFELWFLLHYEYTTASMTNNELIKKLKLHYPKYAKNVDIYHDIKDMIECAIKRAKELEKYQLDNKKIIGTVEANPYTEVYKLIEKITKY